VSAGSDILQRIALPRDQVRGTFRLQDGVLVVPATQAAQIELPILPPEGYRLHIVAERTSGTGSLNVGLVVDSHQTMAVLEGWGQTYSGLNLVDGQPGNVNSTARPGLVFAAERPADIMIAVTPNSVDVAADGNRLIAWRGDAASLSLDQRFWKVRTPNRLTIGAWDAEFRISRLELFPAAGELVEALPQAETTASLQPPSPVDGWAAVDGGEFAFYVHMPQAPTRAATADGVRFLSETEQGAYLIMVSSADLEGRRPAEFVKQMADEAFDAQHRRVHARPLDEAGDRAGYEIAVIDPEGDLIQVQYHVKRDRFYQVMFVGPQSALGQPHVARFLNSFQHQD